MICAATPEEIKTRGMAFICKWRLKCRAVADRLEAADGEKKRLPCLRRCDEIQSAADAASAPL
jgi:hypothetical protein